MQTKYGSTPLLPVEAYTSEEWFDREQRDLFSKVWHFAGMESDAAEPGDYFTVQVGLNPLFVVRGDDHRLRAFHNLCRHRGTQLLRATGKSSTGIVCPYHNWTYSINGDLITVPQSEVFADIDLDGVGLHRASVATWKGMIFVHPEEQPETTFVEWLADFPDYFGPHEPGALVEIDPIIHDWKANWKIVVENYIDGYHLFHLHADTLDMYDHAKAETSFRGKHFAFYEPPVPYMNDYLEKNRRYILEEVGDEDWGAFVHMMFPCTGLTGLEMSFSVFQIQPLEPALTRVHIRNFTNARGKSALRWDWRSRSTKAPGTEDPLASGDFMEEDRYACEQQQKAMYSPMFGVGATADRFEDGVLGFQRNVAGYLDIEDS